MIWAICRRLRAIQGQIAKSGGNLAILFRQKSFEIMTHFCHEGGISPSTVNTASVHILQSDEFRVH